MNLKVIWTSRFKKDYKLAMRQNKNIELLDDIIRTLASGKPLPEHNDDHRLTGNWSGYRECHIENDWVLIYCIKKDILVLSLQRTGTHSSLFKK
ncbi:MAG: type II toxin-antitoxin system YafQ family toxin [Clostridia bacterium]|nr:type II toxin-antitoxin system YafQ family toxin [Clostridia bacterium]